MWDMQAQLGFALTGLKGAKAVSYLTKYLAVYVEIFFAVFYQMTNHVFALLLRSVPFKNLYAVDGGVGG